MELFFTVLLLIFFVFIFLRSIWLMIKHDEKENEKHRDVRRNSFDTSDFTTTVRVDGFNYPYVFKVDEQRRKIFYMDDASKRIYPFEKIFSVELIEDGDTIFSKSTARTVGGALAGGLFAGGAGAVIGGLSGNGKVEKKVTSVQVKIGVRDISEPSFTVTTFDLYHPQSLQHGRDEAHKIVDVLNVIIDDVDNKN